MITPTSLAFGRLATQHCLSHCPRSLPLTIQRVVILYNLTTPIVRHYATEPVSRPKAHTGRTTSTRKPRAAAKPTGSTSTSSEAGPSTTKPRTREKAKAKPKSKPKAKSKAKPKTKQVKSKAKSKAKRGTKAKPKPKRKTRKPLTDHQKTLAAAKKTSDEIKALNEKALTLPKGLPSTAYQVLLVEKSKGTKGLVGGAPAMAKEVSAQYKALSVEQREHYNHLANENLVKNKIQYRKWIESHNPTQIHEANTARALLRRRAKQAGKPTRYLKLKDDREVKRLKTSYNYFYTERFKSGDFSGITVVDSAKRIGQEWKALSAAEKKPYQDLQADDMARYEQEIKSVYNRDVNHQSKAKAASAA